MSFHYICIGPYCWGKSEHKGGAVTRAKNAWPVFLQGKGKHMQYDLYEVEHDAFVDDQGNIVSSTPPKKIREVRFVGDQRQVKEKFDAELPSL